jgi:uroporphyrinogen decarboxylase
MAGEKLLVRALQGHQDERVPFWFMRQAGRFLPEYREVRSSTKGFLDLCFTPEKAAQVTLQPLDRFGMDAAILFSDILVVPYALGVDVKFAEGEGPVVEIIDTEKRIDAMQYDADKLSPIGETVRLVKKQLPEGAALIGFAGAPWTVACYMLQGKGGKEFAKAREFAYAYPDRMQKLVDVLSDATIDYLRMQIDAGAEAIQLFDSWAGLLPPDQFARWATPPARKIFAALKQSHPHIPLIGFAKGAGMNLKSFARESGADAIGIDQHTEMEFGISCRHGKQAVQGNLDPLLLAADKSGALKKTEEILKSFKNVPAVFNVGHGFVPHTPIENVAAVSELVKSWRR